LMHVPQKDQMDSAQRNETSAWPGEKKHRSWKKTVMRERLRCRRFHLRVSKSRRFSQRRNSRSNSNWGQACDAFVFRAI